MQVRKKTLQRGKEHQVSEQKSYFNKWKLFEEKINIFLSVDSLHSPWCLFKSIKNRSLFLEHQQVFCDPASISKYFIYHSYKYFHLEAGKPQIWGCCRFWNREGGSFRFYQIFRFCRVFVLQNFSSYVPLSSGQAWHGPPAPPACPHTLHNRLNRQMCSLHVELLGNPHEQVQFSIVCQAHKAQGGCWKPRGWELEQISDDHCVGHCVNSEAKVSSSQSPTSLPAPARLLPQLSHMLPHETVGKSGWQLQRLAFRILQRRSPRNSL